MPPIESLILPRLELQQVEMGYADLTVLREVTLDVVPGEVIAVIGPNGVGKSTLVRVASGMLPPLSGRVRINGSHLGELAPAERARLVSVVPQATSLPPAFLAQEVVLMGRTPYLGWFETENESDYLVAREAMERTDTVDLTDRPIGELSGGEQQRLLIARALAQAAPIMLLDEPTAHLDLRHQDRVLGLVRALAKDEGLAVLLALHDLNLVSKFADRVALLSESVIRKVGTPEEVLDANLLEVAYGIRIQVVPSPIDGKPWVLSAE